MYSGVAPPVLSLASMTAALSLCATAGLTAHASWRTRRGRHTPGSLLPSPSDPTGPPMSTADAAACEVGHLTVRVGTTSNSWDRWAIFMFLRDLMTSPESGSRSPVIICSCVVLPAPFTPAPGQREGSGQVSSTIPCRCADGSYGADCE